MLRITAILTHQQSSSHCSLVGCNPEVNYLCSRNTHSFFLFQALLVEVNLPNGTKVGDFVWLPTVRLIHHCCSHFHMSVSNHLVFTFREFDLKTEVANALSECLVDSPIKYFFIALQMNIDFYIFNMCFVTESQNAGSR